VYDQFLRQETLNEWFYLPAGSCTSMVDGLGACVVTPQMPIPNGSRYIWTVDSLGTGDLIMQSFSRPFKVNAPLSEIVTLLTPADGVLLRGDENLTWTATDGTSYYQLQIRTAAGEDVFSQLYTQDSCMDAICNVPLPVLPSGDYTWTVGTWLPANGTEIRMTDERRFKKL